MTPDELHRLGDRLRAAGLTSRALEAWAGTDRIAALPRRLSGLALHDPVPAAAALAMFVGGAEVGIDRLRLPIDELVAAGLVDRAGDRVCARVAVLPLGTSLLVCDRLEAPDEAQLVCWPDDSSHHLAGALPAGRRTRWIDLGSGSAFAALARPELATAIRGIDINPRAVAYARLGAALSRITHLAVDIGDLATACEPAELVTCNAPIPGEWDEAVWRRADETLFARLWPALRAAVAPGGEIVVHALHSQVPADLPGESVTVIYTPPGSRPFGVLWWRPDAPARRILGHRALTHERPHLDARDHADGLAGAIMP